MLKVAILGTVNATRILSPFHDDEWEIWPCSPGNRDACPRVTRWFELHGIEDMNGPENAGWCPDYWKWLKAQPFPVYMQEKNDTIPDAIVFPYKDVIKNTGSRLPFSSSIAWMIGYALLLGAKEIGIYGVDMAAGQENYEGQKFGCLRMMEIAIERGVIVHVPLASSLATYPPLYGYAEATRMGRNLFVKKLELQKGIADLDTTIERLVREREQFRGALDVTEFMRRTYVDGEDAQLNVQVVPEHLVVTEPPAADFGAYTVQKGTGLLVPKHNGSGEASAAEPYVSRRTPDDPRPDVMRAEHER